MNQMRHQGLIEEGAHLLRVPHERLKYLEIKNAVVRRCELPMQPVELWPRLKHFDEMLELCEFEIPVVLRVRLLRTQ